MINGNLTKIKLKIPNVYNFMKGQNVMNANLDIISQLNKAIVKNVEEILVSLFFMLQ